MISMMFSVMGADGHRQRVSFRPSYFGVFTNEKA